MPERRIRMLIVTALFAAAGLGGWAGGAGRQTPRRKVLVRRDIMSLAADGPEIAAFRKGVKVMKNRPVADPTSWAFQADLHTKYCQHGNYFFLPWHRMYGYWFERILREASGDPEFSVPYWNYASPTARALPEAFRVPASDANPLYVAQRNQDAGGLNNGAQLPASATLTFWHPFRLTNFETTVPTQPAFGGLVVAKPQAHAMATMGSFESYHNIMHVLLGGEGGFMSDLTASSRDPVFWIHHNNIDRLWKRWLDQGGGRANPRHDKNWMEAEFIFYDEKGKQVTMKVKDALDTDDQLHYRYDDDPPPSAQPRPGPVASAKPHRPLAASKGGAVELAHQPVRIAIELGEEAKAAAGRAESALALLVEGIHFDKEPAVFYEVYVNLPADEAADFQSVHYAGNLCFAGIAPDGAKGHPKMKMAEDADVDHLRALDVTAVIRALRARQLWNDDQLTVTFVMNGLVPLPKNAVARPGTRARFERVRLAAT